MITTPPRSLDSGSSVVVFARNRERCRHAGVHRKICWANKMVLVLYLVYITVHRRSFGGKSPLVNGRVWGARRTTEKRTAFQMWRIKKRHRLWPSKKLRQQSPGDTMRHCCRLSSLCTVKNRHAVLAVVQLVNTDMLKTYGWGQTSNGAQARCPKHTHCLQWRPSTPSTRHYAFAAT